MRAIPCKDRRFAMDTGVGFVVWGGMDALALSHDARGASISWPVCPAAGNTIESPAIIVASSRSVSHRCGTWKT